MKRLSISKRNLFRRAKRREDLWLDSDSDDENRSFPRILRSSSKENQTSMNCCLICSILKSLTDENCCSKHLNLLASRTHRCTSRNSLSSFCSSLSSSHSKRKRKRSFEFETNEPNFQSQSQIEFIPHRSEKLQANFSLPVMSKKRKIRRTSSSTSSPCIRLERVVHVKDDNERNGVDRNSLTLNMTEATKQMMSKTVLTPKIILKRVDLDCFSLFVD